jgi:hypothetical protein
MTRRNLQSRGDRWLLPSVLARLRFSASALEGRDSLHSMMRAA